MGLDMMVYSIGRKKFHKKYTFENYKEEIDVEEKEFRQIIYWRKAYKIFKWFAQAIPGYVEEDQIFMIDRETLLSLQHYCLIEKKKIVDSYGESFNEADYYYISICNLPKDIANYFEYDHTIEKIDDALKEIKNYDVYLFYFIC